MALDRQEIARLVHEGKTYQQIADQMGRSRERIRQIADRMGLHDVMTQRKAERRWLRTDGRVSKKYGMPMEKLRVLWDCGATRAYTMQRRQARDRGIEWLFDFDSWWKVWDASGRWEQRGRRVGEYVMARKGDAGPYSPENVYICTCTQNLQEMQALRKQLREAGGCDKVRAA